MLSRLRRSPVIAYQLSKSRSVSRAAACCRDADRAPFAQGWITDDDRTTVFGSYADEYARLRPFYPDQLFQHIVTTCKKVNSNLNLDPLSNNPAQALDLGTGTGRAALELHNVGFIVTAAEPDVGMLQQARRNLADCRFANFMNAAAEDTGFAKHRFDLVTCFQAWHWVDNTRGLAEVQRILKPDGCFVVAWNDRDLNDENVQMFETLMEKYNTHYHRDARQCDVWADRLTENDHFELLEYVDFNNHLTISNAQHLIELAHTFSYVKNALTPVQLQAFDEDVKEAFADVTDWKMPLLTRTYILKPTIRSSGPSSEAT
eukprot:TRINITY_DN7492_c0_g1_i1.p1 TRINITY_DN7492_c0_g1~~TRINITY_DN7492_c0_g1_i1.p1  ORF type:complete len:317 (+),score=60.00 TRINITY_DN7492_c0_g1_i1:918-1868(+)